MTVFISYSRKDQAFVDRLSIELLNHNVKVWRDEYKLSAGDSLTQRIQGGIEQSSFLCVVISDSALASEWVKKEIAAGLLRAQERRGLTIVPLLIEPVPVPEALRDYLWIDFNQGHEEGIGRLLAMLERRYAIEGAGGRIEGEDYFFFWGAEEGYVEGRYDLLVEIVSFDREERFCILSRIRFRGNDEGTEEGFRSRHIDSPRDYLLSALAAEFAYNPARVSVRVDKPSRVKFSVTSEDGELVFTVKAEVKMLGASEGVTTVFNLGAMFAQL